MFRLFYYHSSCRGTLACIDMCTPILLHSCNRHYSDKEPSRMVLFWYRKPPRYTRWDICIRKHVQYWHRARNYDMGLVYTNPVQLKIKFSSIRQEHEGKILIAKSFKDIHSILLISDKRRIHAKYKLISNHIIYLINNANYINAIYTFRYITFVSRRKRGNETTWCHLYFL